jgi:VWFA-related protein
MNRIHVITTAFILLSAVSSQSQKKAQSLSLAAPPPLVERIDVSVVNVDVTVTDRHGQAVAGLTRNDFEIYEDGILQPISSFYSIAREQLGEDGPPTGLRAEDPAPPPERFRRKVLVLLDNVSATVHGRNEALSKLETFITDHFDDGRYDWSIAVMDSGVHLVLPMTSDKKVLHDVISEIRRSPSRKEMKAPIQTADFSRSTDSGVNRTQMHEGEVPSGVATMFLEESKLSEQMMFAASSTGAILQAVRAFGASEGRKIVLLVVGSLPLAQMSPIDRIGGESSLGNHIQSLTGADRDLNQMREQLIHEANASNASFYIISADGLEVPDQEAVGSKTFGAPPARSNAPDTSSMYWLANETGGAYMPGNRIEQSFAEFDRRSSTFYSLGYVPPHPDDRRYHRLTVRLRGLSGYHLQYRDGYSTAPTDSQITRVLKSPLGAAMQPSTMPMSLIVGSPRYRGVTAVVGLKASMTMESLQYITDARGSRTRLHVYVSVFDRYGRNITLAKSFADISLRPNERAIGPMTVTIPSVALAKGTYRIVVALRDELTDKVALAECKVGL